MSDFLVGGNGQTGGMYLKDAGGNTNIALRADANSYVLGGNVGIGTDLPQYQLHATGDVRSDVTVRGGSVQADDLLRVGPTGQLGLEYDRGNHVLSLGGDGTLRVVLAGGSITGQLAALGNSFLTGGNFGVGTGFPGERLEIAGNLLLNNQAEDGPRLIWRGGMFGTLEYRAHMDALGVLSFFPGEGAPTKLALTRSGELGIGVSYPSATLHVQGTNPTLQIGGTAQAGLYYGAGGLWLGGDAGADGALYLRSGAGVVQGALRAGGTSYLLAGNLGIGTDSPQYKLDTAGTGHFTGDLVVDAALYAGNILHVGPTPLRGLHYDRGSCNLELGGDNNQDGTLIMRGSNGDARGNWDALTGAITLVGRKVADGSGCYYA